MRTSKQPKMNQEEKERIEKNKWTFLWKTILSNNNMHSIQVVQCVVFQYTKMHKHTHTNTQYSTDCVGLDKCIPCSSINSAFIFHILYFLFDTHTHTRLHFAWLLFGYVLLNKLVVSNDALLSCQLTCLKNKRNIWMNRITFRNWLKIQTLSSFWHACSFDEKSETERKRASENDWMRMMANTHNLLIACTLQTIYGLVHSLPAILNSHQSDTQWLWWWWR